MPAPTSISPRYLDPRSGRTWPVDPPRWRADDGAPLMLTPMPGITRREIASGTRSLWRYRRALPVADDVEPVSLGEGCTPLIVREVAGARAHLKLEWFAPTGSFKDRGASVMLTALRAQGVTAVLEDSSGNGGAAIAAYAAAAGMASTILVPASTSPAKIVQMKAAGATIELVPGTRQDCAEAALARAETIFYASHNWHPFFLQGTKTLAYELWEDLGFRAPDNVIIPCGAGSNVLGCDLGFGELLRAGEIDRLPRLFAVQPANVAPIAAAFAAGSDAPVPCTIASTIAEGSAIAHPIRLAEVLGAIRRSGGAAVTVTEAEIEAALFALARSGLYVEPTCATTAAAFANLLLDGTIGPEETTVLVLTGTGLKATQRIAALMGMEV
jgi:threonine synthase